MTTHDEELDYSEDVLQIGKPVGKCPRCDAILHEPETTYDDDGVARIEGPAGYWCPACGWEEQPDAADR